MRDVFPKFEESITDEIINLWFGTLDYFFIMTPL